MKGTHESQLRNHRHQREGHKSSLPLLANLPESAHWHARSSEQAALRAWLEKHRSQLVWDEARSQYQIASGNITRGKKPE